MADSVTSLRLRVDSTDVTKAQKELDGLTSASGRAEKGAQGTASSFSMLGKVLTAGAVIGVTAQYIKLADTMTGIQSKLKLVTNSTSELATAQEELFKIAQKTRQGYAETVDTYSNFAMAMGEMGKSQKDILRVTETVNKAIAISGGTAQQAAAATMQLGQAFASGTLRGDELNSILENSKGLARAIADGMGVPIGQLRKLGSEGKITAEVLAAALEKSAASVDEKFGKVGVTVSASVTTMENSLLKLVGTADQAMNGSGGIAEVFTYFAKSMDDNNDTIIESGKDAFRALQVMGVGMIQLGTSFYQAGVAIPTAIALAIDSVTQLMENGVNNMIGMAEDATNKIKSLYGGDRVKLGRVDIDTNLSKELLSHYQGVGDLLENAKATQTSLFKDIMGNTTELKKIAPPSDKGTGKKAGVTTELTKEQIAAAKKAAKEAEKLREEEAKIQRGYLEAYAELEAQAAIAQYEMELGHINDLADRQTQSAIAFYEITRTEKDKINEENLALYESNVGLFNDEQMQTFFAKWQESIEGVKGGYNDIQGIVSSFVEDSLNSKDWTAGLTGTAKSVANLGNAFKDLDKQNKKYETARKKIVESKGTDEEKSIANKKIENAQFYSQIDAYGALAGAAAGFFEQGSSMAKAMAVVQGGLAIVSAGAGGDPYTVIPRMIAAAAMVAQTLSASGISGGGGGVSGQVTNVQSQAEAYGAETELITDRLDRQIELLEVIGKVGSAAQVDVISKKIAYDRTLGDLSFKVAQDVVTADRTEEWRRSAVIQLVLGGSAASGVSLGSANPSGGAAYLNTTALAGNVGASIKYINFLNENIDKINFAGIDRFERADVTGWVNDILKAVSEFSVGLIDNINALKSASLDFQDAFDSITGTTKYETMRLSSAYDDVYKLIGDDTFPNYLEKQIDNIAKLGLTQQEVQTLLIQDTSALVEQEIILTKVSQALGMTFEGGAKDALDYIDSIELVAENMVRIKEDTKSVFDDIKSFIDDLTNTTIKNPSVTFGIFSESFNSMIDAIATGSKDMIDISGKAMDNARSYIDVVTATATASRDIDFAKAMLVNKFSGVIATPDITLNNINSTLNNNNAQLVAELQALKFELNSIKNMTIDQTAAAQSSLISLRGILGEVSSA